MLILCQKTKEKRRETYLFVTLATYRWWVEFLSTRCHCWSIELWITRASSSLIDLQLPLERQLDRRTDARFADFNSLCLFNLGWRRRSFLEKNVGYDALRTEDVRKRDKEFFPLARSLSRSARIYARGRQVIFFTVKMGHRYCRPAPCYHGSASQPPSKRPCCRLQSAVNVDLRRSKSSCAPVVPRPCRTSFHQ